MKKCYIIFVLLCFLLSSHAQSTRHRYHHKKTRTQTAYKPRTQEAKVYVCYSKSAYAYHAYQCHGLNRCRSGTGAVSISEARNMGYVPCKICY